MQYGPKQKETYPGTENLQHRVFQCVLNALKQKDGRVSMGLGKRTVHLRLGDVCTAEAFTGMAGALDGLMKLSLRLEGPDSDGSVRTRALFTGADVPVAYNPEGYLKIQLLTEAADRLVRDGMEMPTGNLYEGAARSLGEHMLEKQSDIDRGRETRELAAVKLEAYGLGLARPLLVADGPGHAHFMSDLEGLVRKLNPDWLADKNRRKEDMPTGLAGHSSSMLMAD